jgi:hypothetical protein
MKPLPNLQARFDNYRRHDVRSRLPFLVAAILLAPVPAMAQDKAAAPANEVVEPSCADLMAGLRVADPGKNPSKQRKAQADAAQDDIATALFWLHGVHFAKGEATLPVTRDWMVAELKRVAEACHTRSPDGSMLLSKAAL